MNDARCAVTELLAEQCAHCRPAPVADPFDEPDLRGPWFEAQFEGTCVDCGWDIEPGDRIRAEGADVGYLCESCGSR